MKHTKIIIASLLAILFFSSCEDFLTDEIESELTQEDFYINSSRINLGVVGCYSGMRLVMNDEWKFTELRSDNTCISAITSSSSDRTPLVTVAHFSVQSSETIIQDYWYNTFQNISNINAIIPSVLDNTYVTLESDRAQYEAELRFMRAFHYFTLVNLFGDMFKVITVIGPDDAKEYGRRSPVSEIYDEIIIPDLTIAAENAPGSYATEQGRITKWAAKSLLAKAYMMIGGADNLASAKTLLEEVLNESPHGLLDDFADVSDPTNEMNNEIIFAVRYKGGSSNGSPFWENFAPQNSTGIIAAGSPDGNNNPTYEIMNLFESDTNDTRSDASFDRFYRSSTSFYSYITKYVDDAMTVSEQAENDWIVLRYADIVLLYAEILAQDGNFSTAHTYVNTIRTRAGKALVADAFTSQAMALDSVYHERKLELAFENHRWFDLLRMNQSYNDENKAMNIIKLHTFTTDWDALYSLFSPLPVPEESDYTNDHLLLPIPQYEIDANNEMDIEQNDGY